MRLILISNRVAIPTEDGLHRAGGLEVVLAPTLKRYEGVWFGSNECLFLPLVPDPHAVDQLPTPGAVTGDK